MKVYPIAETFVSLKGEGLWTGTPMTFIRFAGCNLQCHFCDTDFKMKRMMSEEEIITYIRGRGVRRIVFTGGEPLMHDLASLLQEIKQDNYQVHLETNGMLSLPDGVGFDWIAVSPKNLECNIELMRQANEIKFLVDATNPRWNSFIWDFLERYDTSGNLLVMPVAKGLNSGALRTEHDLNQVNIQLAVDFCLRNPEFAYCHQLHKTLRIP